MVRVRVSVSNALASIGEIFTGVTSSQRSSWVTSKQLTKYEMLESLQNLNSNLDL